MGHDPGAGKVADYREGTETSHIKEGLRIGSTGLENRKKHPGGGVARYMHRSSDMQLQLTR